MTNANQTLGAILYPGFEMLDYFGPLEMFSMLGSDRVKIQTVAAKVGPVAAAIGAEGAIGPKVHADYGFADAPTFDLLLLPGGFGTIPALDDTALLNYLRQASHRASTVMSVCTGSALLAKAGLLDGLQATSNKQFFGLASTQSDQVEWIEQARWVAAGKFYTSSGVSAGMDMSLAVIASMYGIDTAETVANATEYTWHRDANHDPFVSELNAAMTQLL